MSNSYPVLAQQKVVLACEISNTAGLGKKNGQWEAMSFQPGLYYMGSRKHFFLALMNDIISEESAKEIFHSKAADCHGRADVTSTFCNDPIGDNLYFNTTSKMGSISDIASVSSFGINGNTQVMVSVFSCQRF